MNDKAKFWAAVLAGLLVLAATVGGVMIVNSKRRGLRNKNPGNLRITSIPWKGKVPRERNTDGQFEQFEDYAGKSGHLWGLRAMYMDLRGDIEKDGKNTMRALINEYAPKSDGNATEEYIRRVSAEVGITPDARILPVHYLAVMKAMIRVENWNEQPYPDAFIREAMNTK